MVSDQRCSSLTWLSITLQHKLAVVFRSMKLEGTIFFLNPAGCIYIKGEGNTVQ
ncbi:hypothetical protein DAI22_11g230580 [Oryza sativa Japonica Group]|nr:hypothetical protein DAI22_11g230580 [Oryza sativa Japonica Group]